MDELSDANFVDPEIAAALASFPPFDFDAESLPVIRTLMPGEEPGSDEVVRVDHRIEGEHPVDVTVYRSRDALRGPTDRPVVLWMHGGGYVAGNRHMDDPHLESWCRSLDCVCISVEYRLAPEHPYPAALDDCWKAYLWARRNARRLDVDPNRIGVGGRSAGGGLAAGLALRARRRSSFEPSFLLLEYPMLDDRLETPSSRLGRLPIWSRESNAFGWASYLGEAAASEVVPESAAPARAADLTGMPPACVIVGGLDGFRDEDVDFAARLMQAGVPVELHVYPGAPHGFHVFADAGVTRQACRDVEHWLRGQFASGI
jgi:acetyl esterase/lipase